MPTAASAPSMFSERRVGVLQRERQLTFGSANMDGAEAAVGIVNGSDGYQHTALMCEVNHIRTRLMKCLRAYKPGTDLRINRFQGVNAVSFPGFAGEAGQPAQF